MTSRPSPDTPCARCGHAEIKHCNGHDHQTGQDHRPCVIYGCPCTEYVAPATTENHDDQEAEKVGEGVAASASDKAQGSAARAVGAPAEGESWKGRVAIRKRTEGESDKRRTVFDLIIQVGCGRAEAKSLRDKIESLLYVAPATEPTMSQTNQPDDVRYPRYHETQTAVAPDTAPHVHRCIGQNGPLHYPHIGLCSCSCNAWQERDGSWTLPSTEPAVSEKYYSEAAERAAVPVPTSSDECRAYHMDGWTHCYEHNIGWPDRAVAPDSCRPATPIEPSGDDGGSGWALDYEKMGRPATTGAPSNDEARTQPEDARALLLELVPYVDTNDGRNGAPLILAKLILALDQQEAEIAKQIRTLEAENAALRENTLTPEEAQLIIDNASINVAKEGSFEWWRTARTKFRRIAGGESK